MSVAVEFPPAPESATRIRPLIWIDRNSTRAHVRMGRKRMRGVVRVFVDQGNDTELLWEGEFRESEDPLLKQELDAAAKFYGVELP